MTIDIDIDELRLLVQDFKLAGSPMFLQTTQMNEILDRLEAAEQTVQDYMRIDREKAQIAQRLEEAEKERDALRGKAEAVEKNLRCCQAEREEAAALFLSVKTKLLAERDALRAKIAEMERQELGRLHDELGKSDWIGFDDGWNAAINTVRTEIENRIIELTHKYTPEVVDAALAQHATVSGKGNA